MREGIPIRTLTRRVALPLWAVMVLAAALSWAGAGAPAAPPPVARPSLYDVQAVYLFDFVKFTRWPAQPQDGTLDLCVAGERPLVESLKKVVTGEMVAGHSLRARAVERPAEESGCDLLFLAGREDSAGMLHAADGKAILTVSDMPDFLDRGGMIQFVTVDDRVRFSVNLSSVSHGGLSLSSELLKVALHVDGSNGGAR